MAEYVPPLGSGTSTMSRASESIETVFATGSSDATISVSVRNVVRPTPASTPISSTFTRAAAGEGETVGEAPLAGSAVAPGPGDGRRGLPGAASAVRRREHDPDFLAGHVRRVAEVGLGTDREDCQQGHRDRIPAPQPGQARVQQARPDRREPPHQEQHLEPDERQQGRVVEGQAAQADRPGRNGSARQQAGHQDHRETEQRGPRQPAADHVAEARNDRVKQGGNVAAANVAPRHRAPRHVIPRHVIPRRVGPVRS